MISLIVTFVFAVITAFGSWYFTVLLRGKNISDLGVITYQYRGLALAGGVLFFILSACACLVLIKKLIYRNEHMSAAPVFIFIIFFLFYTILLSWVYG